jgi:hypothetical protein
MGNIKLVKEKPRSEFFFLSKLRMVRKTGKIKYLTIWSLREGYLPEMPKYFLTGDDAPIRSLLSYFRQKEEALFGKLPVRLGVYAKGWSMNLDTLEEFENSLNSLGIKYFKVFPLVESKKRLTDSVYGVVFTTMAGSEEDLPKTKVIGMLDYEHPGRISKLDKTHVSVCEMLGW